MGKYRHIYNQLGELGFPSHERTYFDQCSDEFKHLDFENKLLDIAYLFLHGYDVKRSIHNIYLNHTVSEYTVQRTLMRLLSELIGAQKAHSFNTENINSLIDLLLDNLLRQYHMPYDNTKKHYILHSGKMSEEELMAANPWKEVAAKYIGNSFILSNQSDLICSADKKIIDEYNKSVDEDYQYHLNLPVYPWYGNPLKSSVVVLTLNPAWNDKQDILSKVILNLPNGLTEGFASHLRSMLTFECDSFLPTKNFENALSYRDLANIHQSWYWWNRIKKAFGGYFRDLETVNSKFSLIQYVPYSSRRYKPFKNNLKLPSQYYTRQVIEWILYNRPDTIFIVTRNAKEWKNFLGEDMCNVFSGRFIFTYNNRFQSLTAETIDKGKNGNENFKKILSALGMS